MPRLIFTQQLRRFTEVPELQVQALVLRAALEEAFAQNLRLRGYILDDQGHLRPNVIIFIDGLRLKNFKHLDDALNVTSEVHILQALSGG